MGMITSIVYQPAASDVNEKRFKRVPAERVMLEAGHGIRGDRKAGRHPQRHLNIMMRETLDILAEEGYDTSPGAMGEQLQISGLDIERLPRGTTLRLGATAIIRLNKPRSGCTWLAHVQERASGDTTDQLGLMASVIASGEIRVGDAVVVERVPEPEAI